MDNIENALRTLGIKKSSQQVFLFLVKNGVSPVSVISNGTNTPKSSIYDSLEELNSHGLTIEFNQGRSKEYGVIKEEQLKDVVLKKIHDIKSAESALINFMHTNSSTESSAKTKIKFYTGNEGIRQAFRDTVWHEKCAETYLMWPTEEMIDILTPEFSKWHSEQRLKYEVQMYIIRKNSDRKLDIKGSDKDSLLESAGWKNYREIRYAPEGTEWTMSYWIYDDKCLFASSSNERFAFIVHSKEFANLMKILWKNTWNISQN